MIPYNIRSDWPLGCGKAVRSYLPTDAEKAILALVGRSAPVAVSGARDDPEQALANLLTALQTLGLITDTTTPT